MLLALDIVQLEIWLAELALKRQSLEHDVAIVCLWPRSGLLSNVEHNSDNLRSAAAQI